MTSGKGPRAILPEATSPAGPPDSSPGSESPGSQIRARPVHEQHRLAGHPVHADLPDRWVHRPGGSGESRPTASTEGPAVPGRPAVWTTPSATSTPVAMTAAEAATASAISTGRRRRRAWDAPWREPGKAPVLTVRDYPRNRVRGASVQRIEGIYAACPTTCPISVAPRSWAIRLVTARTFSRISSAVAVHWNGFGSAFQSSAKRLIAWLRTLADEKVPRRIS